MVRIHGIAYIVIGIVIAAFSYSIEKLEIFLWAGIAFVVFGFLKLFIDSAMKPKRKAVAHKHISSNNPLPPVNRLCSRCGTNIHNMQNFCHNCGIKLK